MGHEGREEASASAREAISSYRILAAAQPDVFLNELRDALELGLQILDELGRSEERESESMRAELERTESFLSD